MHSCKEGLLRATHDKDVIISWLRMSPSHRLPEDRRSSFYTCPILNFFSCASTCHIFLLSLNVGSEDGAKLCQLLPFLTSWDSAHLKENLSSHMVSKWRTTDEATLPQCMQSLSRGVIMCYTRVAYVLQHRAQPIPVGKLDSQWHPLSTLLFLFLTLLISFFLTLTVIFKPCSIQHARTLSSTRKKSLPAHNIPFSPHSMHERQWSRPNLEVMEVLQVGEKKPQNTGPHIFRSNQKDVFLINQGVSACGVKLLLLH